MDAMNPPAVALWSAVPTPLTLDLAVDAASVDRMVEAAVADRTEGLFIAGTCGEGPWLPDRERRRLMESAVQAARGRLKIAAQVSDNSVPRVLDNAAMAAAAGVDLAIVTPPVALLNATPERIVAFFRDVAAHCPLPLGIYDLGSLRPIVIPPDRLAEVYSLPQVRLVKDSSGSAERRASALMARAERPGLRLLNGDEFRCLEYLESGYDGCMFGGAIAVMPLLHQIARALAAGDREAARRLDEEMRGVLYGIYGGKSISCWLTGLKHYLVCRGLFSTSASFLQYPLNDECRAFIERYAATSPGTVENRQPSLMVRT